jgi:hypothetical protein
MTLGQVDQVIEFDNLENMDKFIRTLESFASDFRRLEPEKRPSLSFYVGSTEGVTVGLPGLMAVQG